MNNRWFEILTIVLDKGLLTILAVLIGFWLKKWQEDQAKIVERQHVPRTEVDLQCRFFGPQQGELIVEVAMRVKNKGATRRKFKSMEINLRGIDAGKPLELWKSAWKGKVDFPRPLLKDDLLLRSERADDYYYVEPQIEQVFTYITKVPMEVRFIRAHLKCVAVQEKQESKEENTFTEERLFEVPQQEQPASRLPVTSVR